MQATASSSVLLLSIQRFKRFSSSLFPVSWTKRQARDVGGISPLDLHSDPSFNDVCDANGWMTIRAVQSMGRRTVLSVVATSSDFPFEKIGGTLLQPEKKEKRTKSLVLCQRKTWLIGFAEESKHGLLLASFKLPVISVLPSP